MAEKMRFVSAVSSKVNTKPFKSRKIVRKILSVEQEEGAGARVRRSIGRREIGNFDPFLMLDEFRVGLPGGFPDHPHRGFETVTYLLPDSEGKLKHEDFSGHMGLLQPGGLQWMTAGRGVVHSEVPESTKEAHGLQLWINLPQKLKLCKPRYQELPASKLPQVTRDGVTAIVIAGEALGVQSPVYTYTPTYYTHFIMDPKSTLQQRLPSTFQTFLYILKGSGYVGDTEGEEGFVEAHRVVTMEEGKDGVTVNTKENKLEFVLVSGQPLGENIVQHGPFVMNTREEIREAIRDYQLGRNGFENAHRWNSVEGQKCFGKGN